MLHRFRIWSFVLVALLVGAMSSSLRADADRPFRGSAEGMITGMAPPNELIVQYTGNATHLGNFTREEHLFVGPNGSLTGTIVFTAANGDQLRASLTGAFT